MINAFLQEQAVLYVSGAMLPQEREQFELVLEFHYELRECVGELAEVGAAITLATLRPGDFGPSPGLKARILGLLRDRAQQVTSDGLIMSGPAGLVQWINPAFSAMCGYTLEELRGKKLGPILQGEKTDRETALSCSRDRFALTSSGVRSNARETIADYDRSSGKFLRFLETMNGRQPGDPDKAADAIIGAVESAAPPLRLVLGKYANDKVRKKLASAASELAALEHLGPPTDFTPNL